MSGITKRFAGVTALDSVNFNCELGEIHALVGENGAGKSTLMNLLGGLLTPTEGTIRLDGKRVELPDPNTSYDHGIGFVHQESNLLTNLTVAENMFLSHEILRKGVLDRATMRQKVMEVNERLGYKLDPDAQVGSLKLADQQLTEIARAVLSEPKLLIMDEPTAALSEEEVERLFAILLKLRDQGVGIIYISHRLEEVVHLADRVTVFKDGKNAGYDIVFAERLAKDLGVELQLVPTKWAGIIPALMAGKFDVIIGSMSVTPERNLKANFTVPYDYATIEVMANKEKTKGMKFPEDFNKPEVVVALRTGSTPVPVAKKVLPNATFRLFDDEAPAVQDVLSGRADVMFSSAPLPAFEVLRNPDKLYQPSTDAFYRQPVGMVIRKGDPDSLNVLDNWIRTVEAEGWLPERRHFWFKTTDWEAQLR